MYNKCQHAWERALLLLSPSLSKIYLSTLEIHLLIYKNSACSVRVTFWSVANFWFDHTADCLAMYSA